MKPAESQGLQFFVNGVLHQLPTADPTMTVLDYLRGPAGLTGSKEGCAEGDCGACTTVLAELAGDRIALRSINACIQFLPTLDGRELLTVEGLVNGAGELHPVQQAMLDQHGSQCGFCTPGFVMSLLVLFKQQQQPNPAQVRAALAGNLCRCTGYRPILAAAEAMYGDAADSSDWLRQPGPEHASGFGGAGGSELAMVQRLRSIRRGQPLALADSSLFLAPRSSDGVAEALLAHPDALLLAGGTDVGLWVTKEHKNLGTVVFLGEAADLAAINSTDAWLEFGAGVSLTRAFAVLVAEYPGLAELARRFASPPICNSGTLVGNIANGSPIGDSMPALMCLDAVLVLRRGDQRRQLALDQFYPGFRQTALQPGEFVEAVRVPRARPGQHLAAYKVAKRRDQDISAVLLAIALQLQDGKVAKVAVCLGGVAATPWRASHCQQALLGQTWGDASVRAAMRALGQDIQPIDDLRASAGYRLQVAQNLLLSFLAETTSSGPVRVFDLGRLAP